MLNHVINWSLRHRVVVLILTLVMVGLGIYSFFHLSIDAFPDTTPVQVQINTVAPSLSSLEIEQQITFPVEQVISGLPGLTQVRSVSKFGLSQVVAIFEDGTDIYFARQRVMEQLQAVELPQGIHRPKLGPMATGLGEVYHYLVTGKGKTLEELTTIHDWVIKTRLRSVPGVAEVNTWGGHKRQYQVLIDPEKLVEYNITMDHIIEALHKNNQTAGGGYIQQGGEMHVVQGQGLATTVKEIGQIPVTTREGIPILLRDLGKVKVGHVIRRGAVTAMGKGEVVLGLGFMLMGENPHQVTRDMKEKMAAIKKTLPKGIDVVPVYDRTELVDQVIVTVEENLLEGAILVVAILFAFLGNLRAGLIVALVIPLSMLFAFGAMVQVGIAASLMSLGAIDFGLIVDSSVIMVENSVRRLAEEGGERSKIDIVRDAALEVRRPTMYGELIILTVFLPILTLEGVEGKLFRPMALTMIFALLASLVLSLTLMPVLASYFLPRHPKEGKSYLVRGLQAVYRPVVHVAVKIRYLVMASAVMLLIGGLWLASTLGTEFIPKLQEGAVVANTIRLSGVSLDESVRYGNELEKVLLKKFPDEVRYVWSRTGTAEVATDPMGIEVTDVFMTLHPRPQWKRATTQEELVAEMNKELQNMPGMRVVFSQPIEMRLNEMIAGIRSDVGVKIFGDDFEALKSYATQVETVLKDIPGSADIYVEQVTGLPILEIEVDREAIARHGLPARHVLEMVEALAGIPGGEVRKGQRRFGLVVRLPEKFRKNPESVKKIVITTPRGERLPLEKVAKIRQVQGPSTINREWQKRRIVVSCNVRDRDLGSFVDEARQRIAKEVPMTSQYHVEYGGQFEHLERAQKRLYIVVPIVLALILFLLYSSTASFRDAFMIFTGAPFAALGGVLALWLRGLPFTISAAVGFIAVSGVAVLNGLVLVSTIQQMLHKDKPMLEAIEESAIRRLRPVLMTALVAGLGFVPMALNTGVGAEVQRPLATVVIGGVISDTILTLLVLPALYATFGKKGTIDD